MPDREFLQGVAERIGEEPSFNLILTSSNHPPYTVDMSKEPELTPQAELKNILPPSAADDKLTADRLLHFEYADKYLADFIQKMYKKYPDSLFIITGDHADRWTLKSSPSYYERYAVPLIILGKGVHKDMLPARASGAHMDIVPTVMELILPKGEPYYALGKSVLRGQDVGLHAYTFTTPEFIFEESTQQFQPLPGADPNAQPPDAAPLLQRVQDLRKITAWRVLHGTDLEPAK